MEVSLDGVGSGFGDGGFGEDGRAYREFLSAVYVALVDRGGVGNAKADRSDGGRGYGDCDGGLGVFPAVFGIGDEELGLR